MNGIWTISAVVSILVLGVIGFSQDVESELVVESQLEVKIPSWIKNNADWWAKGQINDDSFVEGIKYLIKENIMRIPETKAGTGTSQEIPSWIKQNAEWWSQGQITDESFVNGIQWLIENGIMNIQYDILDTLPPEFRTLAERGAIVEVLEEMKPFPFPLPRPIPPFPEPQEWVFPFHKMFPFLEFEIGPIPGRFTLPTCDVTIPEDGLGFVFTSHPQLGHIKLSSINGEPIDYGEFINISDKSITYQSQDSVGPFTFDLSGNLYVADTTNNEVYSYDYAGVPTSSDALISRNNNGGLDGISSLKIGSDCRLYVASSNTDEIIGFNLLTGFVDNYIDTYLDEPIDFEFDQDGRIWILNSGITKNIVMFDADDDPATPEVVITLDSDSEPNDIIVGEDYLLLSVDNRIEIFSIVEDESGIQVSLPLVLISGSSIELTNPIYMSVGPQDTIYVSDYFNKRVKVVNVETGVEEGSFTVGNYPVANPFYVQIGIMPEVPFHNVEIPVHPQHGGGLSTYRAYQFPGDNFQIVCELPCDAVEPENLYASYWGFKKGHHRNLVFLGGTDVSSTFAPVDIHLFDDSWCGDSDGNPFPVYASTYVAGDGRGYVCTYDGERHRVSDNSWFDFVPYNRINIDHQMLPIHEYGHNVLRDLIPNGILQEDIVKYASHKITASPYSVMWSDPCDPRHDQQFFGKIFYELCQQNGLTLDDFTESMSRLAQLREDTGQATTIADWVLILNEILGSDTRQAFLDTEIDEAELP